MSFPAHSIPGTRPSSEGVVFQIRAPGAEAVELCFFDAVETERTTERWAMKGPDRGLWQRTIATAVPGQLYGYRVHGPWNPSTGDRFNATKLLIDPGAAAIAGPYRWSEALADVDPETGAPTPGLVDTAPWVPKAVVVDPVFDWRDDRPPAIPWGETVIYECHVRGLTMLHTEVAAEHRGTYLGLCDPAVIDHLRQLGVTAVELLPVQHFVSEEHLSRQGMTNYFGYNPIAWIAPHAGYARSDRGEQVHDFKEMVRSLHRHGIEVILDLVFNHTAEGDHRGPVLSLRGIDNRAHYRLDGDDPRRYENFSGCGNTLHFGHAEVVDLAVAALRYWVEEMHVDGFRFDLATSLARDPDGFNPASAFLERLRIDPTFESIKLIAEPWDLGPAGYQLGRFPVSWREWNDRYRDCLRGFWRGDPIAAGEVIRRVGGSTDLLAPGAETQSRSINFVTCHDGFTLHDLVSYDERHNQANGEGNRDGHAHNLSHNWGAEGPTSDPAIAAQRIRAKRNFVATLAVSRGAPMISHGDEVGRTQSGNNNAYCHDSPLTWVEWQIDSETQEFLAFVRQAIRCRRELFQDPVVSESWISAHGEPLSANAGSVMSRLPFGWLRRGASHISLTILNGDPSGHLFELPSIEGNGHWWLVLATDRAQRRRLRGHAVRVAPRSLLVLEYVLDDS